MESLKLLVLVYERKVRVPFRHLDSNQFFISQEAEFSQGFLEMAYTAEELGSYS
jgi:hypothetical protein